MNQNFKSECFSNPLSEEDLEKIRSMGTNRTIRLLKNGMICVTIIEE